MIREFEWKGDSLLYTGHEYKLTMNDTDVINHPTGLALHGREPVFMGNSVILNKATNQWKAVIYCINWEGLLRTGTLDRGNLMNVIEDDACIQGTRPEYVEYNHKWYVATADYGNRANEVTKTLLSCSMRRRRRIRGCSSASLPVGHGCRICNGFRRRIFCS